MNLGHTKDGFVFLSFESEYKGEKISSVVELSPDNARKFVEALLVSIKNAEAETNERISQNPN